VPSVSVLTDDGRTVDFKVDNKKNLEGVKVGDAVEVNSIRSFGTGTISKAILPVPGTTAYRGAWQQAVKAAEQANDPGHFTAFIGFEWTSNTGGNNLHRNVVFRDDAKVALQIEPYTTMKPLGSTVDLANATWTNTIGAPELIAVWKDPGFAPAQRAFYYARVIEIPTRAPV
jgi:hypothetical protein